MHTVTPFKPLSKEDLADVLGVSIRTVENWVNDGTLPSPTKLGNRVYWHPGIFYAWLDRRLSGGNAADEPTQDASSTAHMPPARAKAKSQPRSVTAKTELDKVRTRTQASLDSLMA